MKYTNKANFLSIYFHLDIMCDFHESTEPSKVCRRSLFMRSQSVTSVVKSKRMKMVNNSEGRNKQIKGMHQIFCIGICHIVCMSLNKVCNASQSLSVLNKYTHKFKAEIDRFNLG